MSDPLFDALNRFMGVVKEQVGALREENRSLRAELEAVRVEVRASPPPPPPAPAPEVVPGPPGRGVQSAEIREGRLVLRYTDGEEAILGNVAGEPGKDAEVDPAKLREMIRAEIPTPEPPKQGEPGVGIRGVSQADGHLIITLTDGTAHDVGRVAGERGADGIASEADLEARIEARFSELQTRTLADTYRGVFRVGERYTRGATASFEGGLWLALADTTARPGTSEDWKLVAKRGRDGRDRT